jgi:hypothetical protein
LSTIFQNAYTSKNINNISNEQNTLENNFINKKTKRNEETKKNKIFLIKKVKDKSKEIEDDKKKLEKFKSIHRRSKYRGVLRKGKGWQAFIMINRQKNYIGNFNTEEEAAKVYDEYAMKFHKNKARLNFPHKGYLSIYIVFFYIFQPIINRFI